MNGQDNNKIFNLVNILNILFISLVILLTALIIYPVKPASKDSTEIYWGNFRNKIELYKQREVLEIYLTEKELAAFIKKIISQTIPSLKDSQNSYFVFPSQVIVELDEKEFSLFLSFKIISVEIFLGLKGNLQFDTNRKLVIKPKKVTLGKLTIPYYIVDKALKTLRINLKHKLPGFIKNVRLGKDELYLTSKIRPHRRRGIRKEKALSEAAAQPAADLEEPEAEETAETEEEIAEEEITEEETYELKEKSPEADETKDLEPQPVRLPETLETSSADEKAKETEPAVSPKEKAAAKLHQLGNYFYRQRHFDLALKYYEQLINHFPDYSKANEVRELAAELSIELRGR